MTDLLFTTTSSGVSNTDILFSSEAYSAPEVNFNFLDGEYTPGYDFEFDPLSTREIYPAVLRLDSLNVTSIWADDTASFNSGKVYIATSNELNIFNLTTNIVVDQFSQILAGHANEPLTSSGIVDINVVG